MRDTTRRRRLSPLSWATAGTLLLLAIVGAAFAVPSVSAPDVKSTAPVVASTPAVAPTPIVANPATQGTALALLDTLPVKGRAPKTGYDRTGDFGTAWLDVDRNGCDTRNDILARDLAPLVKAGECNVTSGTLHDPVHGQDHRLHSRQHDLNRRSDRPCRPAPERVGDRSTTADADATDRSGQRPPEPLRSRRTDEFPEECWGCGDLAAPAQGLPLHVRCATGLRESGLRSLGHSRRARRHRWDSRHLPQ
jgi:hypothetical protein